MPQRYPALAPGTWIETNIPQRLDRLPWSRWHWLVVLTLGVTWLLDGLEVTIVGAVAGVLIEPDTLNLTDLQVGSAASIYLLGAILGSLIFGRLTDRFGRKKLFLVTLTVYLIGTLTTSFSWNFSSFALCRGLTGVGIGGEGSAMSSAIDELLPARVRGRAGIALNGTYWLGTAMGALLSLVLLNPSVFPRSIGWRFCFGLGAVLGVGVLWFRRHLPESPRWLLVHGRVQEANSIIKNIEESVKRDTGHLLPPADSPRRLQVKGSVNYRYIIQTIIHGHRKRAILGLSLIISQAFAYNAVFFTYALVLRRFYGVQPESIGLYLLPFAIGNWLGPMLLSRYFDTVGRKTMISLTYGLSGILLALTGFLFAQGVLTAFSQTMLWCLVFFIASSAASAAYLTVSELFPVEMRGLAIALFYSVGTGTGGMAAPAIFGALIQSGSRQNIFYGYILGALLMVWGSFASLRYGVSAEGKSLETLSDLSDVKENSSGVDNHQSSISS